MSKRKKYGAQIETQSIRPAREYFWTRHPDQTAIALLAAVLLVFFWNVLFTGQTLLQPDVIASRCFQPFVEDALARGIYPLWNPYIFGGMPSFASLSSAPYVDVVNWLIMKTVTVVTFGLADPKTHFLRVWFNYFFLGAAVYWALRDQKKSPAAGLFAATALVFMPQVVAYAAFGHNTKLGTAVFIPVLFVMAERLFEKRNLLWFSLTGLAAGLALLRAHVQIWYYAVLMMGIYFIYWAVLQIRSEKKSGPVIHAGLLFAGALTLGVLVSAVLNFSVWEYAKYSIRGGGGTGGLAWDYATNWSFPPNEVVTFFIPSFMGFGGGETYWGQMTSTEFPRYFGLVTLILAAIAMTIARNRRTVFFGILALVSLIVSFGGFLPILFGPMFKFLPYFSKFRSPEIIHVLFEFALVMLAAYGLDALFALPRPVPAQTIKRIRAALYWIAGILGLLILIVLFGKSLILGWAGRAGDPAGAYSLAVNDALKAAGIFILAAGLIWFFVKGSVKGRFLTTALIVIGLADLWSVDHRFVEPRPESDGKAFFAETAEVKYLKTQPGPFRILTVFDTRPANWYMAHLIQDVFGYQGAKVKLYQDLMEAFNMPNGFPQQYIKVENGRYAFRTPSEIPVMDSRRYQTFLRLMNVRYLVTPYAAPPYLLPDPAFSPVFKPITQGANGVLEFRNALSRVFFADTVVVVKDPKSTLAAMANGFFDPAKTALLDEAPPFAVSSSPGNRAVVESFDIHRVVVRAQADKPGVLVFSEIYYPAGWKAYVDGKETTIHRTDYALRSIFLQSGAHRIEMVFQPSMFKLGLFVSIVTAGLLIAGAVVGWRMQAKPRV